MEQGIDVILEDEEVEVDAQTDFLKGDKGDKGDKGNKGDKGDKGDTGEKGDTGYTPVKGIDYYTDNELQAIIQDITSAIEENLEPQEQERQLNEQKRQSNEQERTVSENARIEKETDRQASELTRISNEEIRQNNENMRETKESEREETENRRMETFTQMQESVANAVNNIVDMTEAYNNNATAQTNAFNENATEKTNEFNTNVTTKTEQFDTNATNKTTAFNENVATKTDEYNANAQAKIDEYNANAEALANRVVELETENEVLKNQIPTGQAEGENITLNDSAEMQFKELKICGNSIQEGEPSPETPIEIQNVNGSANITVCNKNLFTGWIKGKGLNFTTGEEIVSTTNAVSDFIKVDFNKNSNYYLSGLTTNLFSLVAGYNKDKVFVGRTAGGKPTYWNLTKDIFTNGTSQGTGEVEYIKITQYVTTSSSSQTIDEIGDLQTQLEVGTVTTEYQPHQSQQYTFPLKPGQRMYKDSYLADDGVHHKRGETVLKGTETWNLFSNNSHLFSTAINNIKISLCKCSHFKGISFGFASTDYSCSTNDYGVYINNKNVEGIDNWKSYLAEQYANGTPVTVEYELANEVIEPYTEEQQKAYDEIKKATSYKNITHIFSTDEISPIFDVTYRKDLETMFNNINNAILGGN